MLLPTLRTLLLGSALLVGAIASAQQEIIVKGKVSGGDGEHVFYDLMIVNRRTRTGSFGNVDGSFMVRALPNDTLLIGAGGYVTRTLPLEEYPATELADLRIVLKPWHIELQPVAILPERTLRQIQSDIDKLGYDPKDYRETGINAFESPITFLYQSFSKRERSKREVAQLRNADNMRELLKDLLHLYVEYDIIKLSDESFDDFIDFCNVPEATLKDLTQYEFLVYVKKKYELYSRVGPTRKH